MAQRAAGRGSHRESESVERAPTPALPRKREREKTALAATTISLAQHRQHDHIIAVADAALEDGIFELVFEAAGRADAALGGKSAAEHRATVGQSLAAKAALNEVRYRQHMIERTFL